MVNEEDIKWIFCEQYNTQVSKLLGYYNLSSEIISYVAKRCLVDVFAGNITSDLFEVTCTANIYMSYVRSNIRDRTEANIPSHLATVRLPKDILEMVVNLAKVQARILSIETGYDYSQLKKYYYFRNNNGLVAITFIEEEKQQDEKI